MCVMVIISSHGKHLLFYLVPVLPTGSVPYRNPHKRNGRAFSHTVLVLFIICCCWIGSNERALLHIYSMYMDGVGLLAFRCRFRYMIVL